MREKADNCTTPKPEAIASVSSDRYSEHSMLWRFSDSDRNSGWLTVTDRGRQITYVEFWGQKDGTSMLTLDKFAWITNRVETASSGMARELKRRPGHHRTGYPDPGGEPVHRPHGLRLDGLHRRAQTASGAGEFDGSSAVVPCDSDTSGQGEFGLLKVKLAGGTRAISRPSGCGPSPTRPQPTRPQPTWAPRWLHQGCRRQPGARDGRTGAGDLCDDDSTWAPERPSPVRRHSGEHGRQPPRHPRRQSAEQGRSGRGLRRVDPASRGPPPIADALGGYPHLRTYRAHPGARHTLASASPSR